MPPPTKTPARTLVEKIWGSDFINSIPEGWRASLRYLKRKTPGVSNGTDPDSLTDVIVSSQVTTNRINELEKETTELDAQISTETEHEQDYDEQFDVVIPKTKYLTKDNAQVGLPRRRIRAFNPKVSEVETFDPTALAAVFDSYLLSFPGVSSLRIPDILTGFDVLDESTIGVASSDDTPGFWVYGGPHSFTLPFRAMAQGSVIINKEVVPRIIPLQGVHRNTTHYLFFLRAPVTRQQVIDKLTSLSGISVVAWPNYNPRYVTIVITSRRVSLQISFGVTAHETFSGGYTQVVSVNNSASREVGLTVRTIRIPPTIHADLTTLIANLGVHVNSEDLTVTADFGGFNLGDLTFVEPGSKSETDNAWVQVDAFGLEATPGITTIPSSGLLIVDVNARPYRYGYVMIQAETIDASTL